MPVLTMVLVWNTGIPSVLSRLLQRNLVHYYAVTQAVLPFLRQSQGCIVNIASKVAITGQGGTSGYAAAKGAVLALDRKSTRLNSSHVAISYAVFCLKKKNRKYCAGRIMTLRPRSFNSSQQANDRLS